MSTAPLITLENVSKVVLTDEVETHALDGVHLDIARGEYVAIDGPSGCGKSTLLSIVGLLDAPTEAAREASAGPASAPRPIAAAQPVAYA